MLFVGVFGIKILRRDIHPACPHYRVISVNGRIRVFARPTLMLGNSHWITHRVIHIIYAIGQTGGTPQSLNQDNDEYVRFWHSNQEGCPPAYQHYWRNLPLSFHKLLKQFMTGTPPVAAGLVAACWPSSISAFKLLFKAPLLTGIWLGLLPGA